MSHQLLGISRCQRGAQSRAHDFRNAAAAFPPRLAVPPSATSSLAFDLRLRLDEFDRGSAKCVFWESWRSAPR
jgi:hypothetical protein